MRILVLIAACLLSNVLYSQWIDFNPGITGDFRDIDINGPTKYICGNSCIYKSTDYITWASFMVGETTEDTEILERTKFNALETFNVGGYKTLVCGYDTVNNQGVIFSTTGTYWKLDHYIDDINILDLGSITVGATKFYAVGENGTILVKSGLDGAWISYSYSTDKTLWAIQVRALDKIMIVGDSIVLNNDSPLVWDSIHAQTIYDLEPGFYHDYYGVSETQSTRYSTIFETWEYNSFFEPDSTPHCLSMETSTLGYIGTANGIYKSAGITSLPWEFQPSSSDNSIRSIKSSGTSAWAVGDGSVMLKTSNSGGLVIPYVNFYNPIGVCVDSLATFFNYGNPAHSHNWYINGSFSSSAFHFEHVFETTGTYEVKLVVVAGIYSDSVSMPLIVYNLPENNKPFDVENTILCKEGDVDFTIHETELGVYYALYNIELDNMTDYMSGTGGDLVLNTGLISDSAHYLISARKGFSECVLFFDDTTMIAVEKTNADFYVSHINALKETPVYFYNHSKQATIFNWTLQTPLSFETDAYDFAHSYSDLGSYTIQLIAESDFGCIDTTIKSGPFIYDTTNYLNACWQVIMNGDGSEGVAYNHNRIHDIETNDRGEIFVVGGFENTLFTTQHGLPDSKMFPGFYVAKYDKFGVLQWIVDCDISNSIDYSPEYANYSRSGDAVNLELGENGSVYFSGWKEREAIFHSNNGDTLLLDTLLGFGFIIKIDSLGRYLWHSRTSEMVIEMEVGPNGDIFAGMYDDYTIKIADSEGIETILSPSPISFVLFKMDSEGKVIFANRTLEHSALGASIGIYDMELDHDYNLNIIYSYKPEDIPIIVYSVDSADYTETSFGHGNAIIQLDSAGNFKWFAKVFSDDGSSPSCGKIDVDPEGNLYGSFRTNNSDDGFSYVEDAEDDTITSTIGQFVIVSLTQDGDFRWIEGIERGNANAGSLCYKDGIVYIIANVYYPILINSNLTSTLPDDSIIFPVQTTGGDQILFAAWNAAGEPQWYSFEDGSTNLSGNPFHLKGATIEVDYEGNILFGGYRGNAGADSIVFAAGIRTVVHTAGSGFLLKYNPAMCFNSIEIDTLDHYCGGDTLSISFNFETLDPIGLDNTYYLILKDDLDEPVLIDTLIELMSVETEGVFEVVIPYDLNGTYHFQIFSSSPYYFTNTDWVEIKQLPIPSYVDSTICKSDSLMYLTNLEYDVFWSPMSDINLVGPNIVYFHPEVSNLYVGELSNSCGVNFDTVNISVISIDLFIDNDTNICVTDSVFLNATGTADIFEWEIDQPNGTYFFPTENTELIVFGITEFCVVQDTLNISVVELPNPSIFLSDGILGTDEYLYYQWFKNGVPIDGATERYFEFSDNGYYHVEVWNLDNCKSSSDLYPISDLGYEETIDYFVEVSPNPTTNITRVFYPKSTTPRSITIYDLTGRNIIIPLSDHVTGIFEIDFSSVASGIYYIMIEFEDKTITKEIVRL